MVTVARSEGEHVSPIYWTVCDTISGIIVNSVETLHRGSAAMLMTRLLQVVSKFCCNYDTHSAFLLALCKHVLSGLLKPIEECPYDTPEELLKLHEHRNFAQQSSKFALKSFAEQGLKPLDQVCWCTLAMLTITALGHHS